MTQKTRAAEAFLSTFLAIAAGLVLSFAFLPFMGINPLSSFGLLFSSMFSDRYTIGTIFVKAAPLILTALSFAIAYRASLFNIGAQGQFYMGAICAVAVTLGLQNRIPAFLVIFLAGLAGSLGGGAVGALIGFLKAKYHANEFLVSMMSTYVIAELMDYLLRTFLREKAKDYLQTDSIDPSTWLPVIVGKTSVHLGVAFAVAAALLVWVLLFKTQVGFRVRAVGLNAEAARMCGIRPETQCILTLFISGFLAGFAGFIEVNGMQHMLITGLDADVGSYGIGIAILGSANPIGILFASVLFGALKTGGTTLGQVSNVPASIIDLMEGFVMIFVLISYFVRHKISLSRTKRLLGKAVKHG
jgi:simple sugar transport system permease protein